MLRGRGDAKGLEQRGNAAIGDIVLLDAGLDGGDSMNFCVEALVASEDIDKVRDLFVGERGVSHERVVDR